MAKVYIEAGDRFALPPAKLDQHARSCVDALELACVNLRVGNLFTAGRMVESARASAWKIHDGDTHARAHTLVQALADAVRSQGLR